jgi:hypothetical protein
VGKVEGWEEVTHLLSIRIGGNRTACAAYSVTVKSYAWNFSSFTIRQT